MQKSLNFRIFRIHSWWNYIVPPVLASVYFVVLMKGFDFSQSVSWILLWLVSIIGTAVFGFSINDIFDANTDAKAGKQNLLATLSISKQISVVLISVCAAIVPWLFLKLNAFAVGLLILQMLLLVFYSVPPFRFKQNRYLSIICDSLYSGLIFIIAVIVAGSFLPELFKYSALLLIIAILTLFLRGLRNILIHQIADAENDQKAGIISFVLMHGKDYTMKIIAGIVVAEIIGIVGFALLLSLEINFWLVLIMPGCVLYFLLKRFDKKNSNKTKLFFIQMLNDFYEDLLPLVFLILLCFHDLLFFLLMVIHVIFFQNKIVWVIVKQLYFFIFGLFYRKLLLWVYYNPLKWLYFKAFHNRYIKKYHKKTVPK